MRRAQVVEALKPLAIDTVDIPAPPDKGLVIKTSFSGICHSDLHQWEDRVDHGSAAATRFTDIPGYKFPLTLGHEIAGVVHSLGSETTKDDSSDLKVGDPVIIYPWIGCQQAEAPCGFCENKYYDKCPQVFWCFGFITPGGYASYVAVPHRKFAIKVPDSVPLDLGCMLACSSLTAYHAIKTTMPTVEEALKIKGSARILIVGSGGLGLWGTQIASQVYPPNCTVTVADIDSKKLEVAKDRGCDATILWDVSKSDEELVKITAEEGGFDAIIDFVNNTITSNRAVKCLEVHGILVMVGLFGGEARYSLPKLVFGHQKIQGVLIGSLEMMKELIKLAEMKKLIPPPMHKIPLDGVTEAMEKLRAGKVEGRYIIEFP